MELRNPKLDSWFSPVTTLQGVGKQLGASLSRVLGKADPRLLDLLFHKPHAVVDYDMLSNREIADGARIVLDLLVLKHHAPHKRSKAPYKIDAKAGDTPVSLVFFHSNREYLSSRFQSGSVIKVYGKTQLYQGHYQITHPELLSADTHARQLAGLRYPLSEGLTHNRIKQLIAQALENVDDLPEWLEKPQGWSELPSFKQCLATIHGLEPQVDLEIARQRLALDELLAVQIALALARQHQTQTVAKCIFVRNETVPELEGFWGFKLTRAQKNALQDIHKDLAQERPMMRLLMGDVGSGKTAVAIAGLLPVLEQGYQAALMAPTTVLAEQHYRILSRFAQSFGFTIALLTGAVRSTERQKILQGLQDGSLQLLVGTHAIFSEDVSFLNLAFAVIDEQQRFGVEQRLELVRKGRAAHILFTTATPIPRSLVLGHYGDLDLSLIKEKPEGRQKIITRIVPGTRLDEILAGLERVMAKQEKVYWICPLIEDEDGLEGPAATERYSQFKERFGDRAGLVHGRMSASEKDEILGGFSHGKIDILVSTTVIEVGIDVPDATVMVIDGAERFGLTQMHQLRGRVGRGSKRSVCMLVYHQKLHETARQRLEILRDTEDGFKLAELDLQLRGSGEILGKRQSGFFSSRFAVFDIDQEVVKKCKAAAEETVKTDPQLLTGRGRIIRIVLSIFDMTKHLHKLKAG